MRILRENPFVVGLEECAQENHGPVQFIPEILSRPLRSPEQFEILDHAVDCENESYERCNIQEFYESVC